MFTWICPQCGREVPPSYTECPDCAARAKVPVSPAAESAQPPANMAPGPEAPPQPPYVPQQTQAAPPPYAPPQYAAYPQYPPQYPPPQGQYPQYPPPQYQPPPPQYQAAPPQYQPPPQYQATPPQYQTPPAYGSPPARKGLRALPTWLLTAVFAVAFVAVVGGVYTLVGRGGSTAASPAATVENPAAKAGAKTSTVQKYVEVSGIRFTGDKKGAIQVKFTITNHSDADLSGLAGNVTIWARTQKSEEDAVGTFAFKADVPPQTSQEVTAPLLTKLKIYELPDWQNVTTDVQITSPQ